jgi:hypothetical protein
MAAQSARHLRVIDRDTGEALEEHPEIEALQVVIKGLERDVRTWIKRYDELKRDKEQEAGDMPTRCGGDRLRLFQREAQERDDTPVR